MKVEYKSKRYTISLTEKEMDLLTTAASEFQDAFAEAGAYGDVKRLCSLLERLSYQAKETKEDTE